MEKKGSITVFLALILSILLSLVSASLQSVQAAATRTQILNGMDIGLYSLFGQYDRSLLRDYDLFFLDGTQGGTELNLAAVYDNLESYIKPVLKQIGKPGCTGTSETHERKRRKNKEGRRRRKINRKWRNAEKL